MQPAAAVLLAALIIFLDPGHTPSNPGAVAHEGAVEATRNVQVANAIHEELETRGALVRQLAQPATFKERTQPANEVGAHLLLSIHHDSVHPEDMDPWPDAHGWRPTSRVAEGFSLHVRGDNKEALRIASAIADALLAAGFKPTGYHATTLTPVDLKRGIYDRRKLAVLNKARVPAVLLECGFLSHPDEARALADASTRSKLARAVARGITTALEKKS